jgi:hypothetical protein
MAGSTVGPFQTRREWTVPLSRRSNSGGFGRTSDHRLHRTLHGESDVPSGRSNNFSRSTKTLRWKPWPSACQMDLERRNHSGCPRSVWRRRIERQTACRRIQRRRTDPERTHRGESVGADCSGAGRVGRLVLRKNPSSQELGGSDQADRPGSTSRVVPNLAEEKRRDERHPD